MTGTVRITITYPTPGTQPDIDAVKSVLIAADPYWVADFSSESTPGKVVFTIDAAGGPVVAAAIADARRAAGGGPRVDDQHHDRPADGKFRPPHVRPQPRWARTRLNEHPLATPAGPAASSSCDSPPRDSNPPTARSSIGPRAQPLRSTT